jgi:hypothetical protein
MHDNTYTVIGAVVLGWLVSICLLTVGYLTWLEIAERRRRRRMEEKRAQMSRENPYRPSTTRRLAFQTIETPITTLSSCPRFRQAFPRTGRHTGWNFNPTGPN